MKYRSILPFITFFLASLTFGADGASADVATDGSTGPAISIQGPDFEIPQTLGTLKGSNLFHSFDKFSISTGESATFTGSDFIKNIISRVTGEDPSSIDGTLRSTIGKADFYFINPNGIIFGPNAKIDVPAAFHVSTSGQLQFEDGSVLSSSLAETSTLTQAPPESFGFLDAKSASIEIHGSKLSFNPESKVSFTSSNNISLKKTDGSVQDSDSSASISAPGGEISFDAAGNISMDGAAINASANGGGKINLSSANIYIKNGSIIAADNTGKKMTEESASNSGTDANPETGIDINASGDLTIAGGSRIQSNVTGDSDSGTITVKTGNLSIAQNESNELTGIFIEVDSGATGNGNSIDVNVAGDLEIYGVAGISGSTSGIGNAASVNVTAGSLYMNGMGKNIFYRDAYYMAGIASNSLYGSFGDTGTVSVHVQGMLSIQEGGAITGHSNGYGNGSNVNISSGELLLDGTGSNGNFTGIATSASSEDGINTININTAGDFIMKGGAQIFSNTYSDGDAGDVFITAGNLMIDNQGINNQLTRISSDTSSKGDAGDITINTAGDIQIVDGAEITSSTFSEGDSGKILINAENILIDNQGAIKQFTGIWSDTYASGEAGEVTVKAIDNIKLIGGGEISSSTSSEGNAGILNITSKNFTISGQGSALFSLSDDNDDIAGNTSGNAGEINIIIDNFLELNAGGSIAALSFTEGNGGSINIKAENLTMNDFGSDYNMTKITSDSYYKGNAGTIEISVGNNLEILNGASISSLTTSEGKAGSINISAFNLKMDSSDSNSVTGIFSDTLYLENDKINDIYGNGGLIDINVPGILEIFNGSQISSSSSTSGNAGTINVSAGSITIDTKMSQYSLSGITNDTYSQGNAGNISIEAESLNIISGYIGSTGFEDSSGYVGNIFINCQNIIMSDLSVIGIASFGNLSENKIEEIPERSITIQSDTIKIDNESSITSKSFENVPAANLNINCNYLNLSGNSTINSSANQADGGDITIQTENIFLDNGLITTSVKGEKGNGGNITISGISSDEGESADFLLMHGGFIQANTSAANASGGEIDINVNGVIADSSQPLEIGGTVRKIFSPDIDINVIQSAAEDGYPGEINISGVNLDISSSVINMPTKFANNVLLATDPCSAFGEENSNSLINMSRKVDNEYFYDTSSLFIEK